ncbi:MAG: cbb3-type cytochrome c oxidase subunit I [Anaerolineales bacterium]|nr:cbb3-type cytochrome c oxidase subunit I [Anaerolineales bacterium]
MPPITRAFIKASLLYLVLAMGLAVFQVLQPWLGLNISGLSPVYFHLFLVGWVTQMIMGVGLWFFPKYSQQRPRGSQTAAWASFWLLNFGLLLRAMAEPAASAQPAAGWLWALVLSAVAQWLAALLFVLNVWPRIKER